MHFKIEDDRLQCLIDGDWQTVGGYIKVVARTRGMSLKSDHGALIQWRNIDNQLIQMVIFNRILMGEQSRQIKDVLIDSGYWLEPQPKSWHLLRSYLLNEVLKASSGICVSFTGWHDKTFVTQDWVLGSSDEPYFYSGELNSDTALKQLGELSNWQNEVGRLCQGNPLMIFSVGVALAAPLLYLGGTENGIFHWVGASSTGKTTLLELAASVYGNKSFIRSWVSTDNGLAAVAAEQHDILLALDELGLAHPEHVYVAVYQIVAGTSKLRATETGTLAKSSHWRTLALSTGEVWLSEVISSLGKSPKAGQLIRLVEIPIFGKFGAFNNLHEFQRPEEFVSHLKQKASEFYGALFYEWIEQLTKLEDASEIVRLECQKITNQLTKPQMASQVLRVVQRFALIGAALTLASRYSLVPWSEKESTEAVEAVVRQWLIARGHSLNHEEHDILSRLERAISTWESELKLGTKNNTGFGYSIRIDGEEQWRINRNVFLRHLNLPTRYMREIAPLLQKNLLETNEPERGTLKVRTGDKYIRYFALWPNRLQAQLKELEIE